MKLRIWIAIFCIVLLAVTSWGQDTSALITVDNADQLQLVSSVGGALPRQLVWSPDNQTLAIQTTQDVTLYHVDDGSSTLLPVAQSQSVTFDEQGNLRIDNQLWNTATGESLGVVQAPPTPTRFPTESAELPIETYLDVSNEVYSPDKRYVAIYGTDTRDESERTYLQLWDVQAKTMTMEMGIYIDYLYSMQFLGESKILLLHYSSNYEYLSDELLIYEASTGERLAYDSTSMIEFSPDNLYFIYKTSNGIKVWSDQFLAELGQSNSEASYPMPYFNPDSTLLAIHDGNVLSVWGMASVVEPPILKFNIVAQNTIAGAVFSDDSNTIVTVTVNGYVQTWDVTTSQEKQSFYVHSLNYKFSVDESGYTEVILDLSDDSSKLLVGDGRNFRQIWQLDTQRQVFEVSDSAPLSPDWSHAAFWQDNKVILRTSDKSDETIHVIDPYFGGIAFFKPQSNIAVFNGTLITGVNLESETILFRQYGTLNRGITLSSDEQRLFIPLAPTRAYDSAILVVNPYHFTETLEVHKFEQYPYVGNWLVSPSNAYISSLNGACGDGGGGTFDIWDGIELRQLWVGRNRGVCGPYAHAFTADESHLLMLWDDYIDVIPLPPQIDVSSTQLQAKKAFLQFRVSGYISLNSDNSKIALLEAEWIDGIQSLKGIFVYHVDELIDNENPEPQVTIGGATRLLFHPSSHYALTDAGFFDLDNGEQLSTVAASFASFSPDGSLLATLRDQTIELWDVTSLIDGSTTPIATYTLPARGTMGFNADGTRLMMAYDGVIESWGILP